MEGMEDTRRPWPSETTKQGSHGLMETEEASVGLQGLYQVLGIYAMAVSVAFCHVFLTVGGSISLILLPVHRTLFFLLGCLIQP